MKLRTFILTLFLVNIPFLGYCFSIKGTEKTLEAPAYKIRGTEYLPLTLICDAYGILWKWDPASMTVDLNKENTTIRLRVGEYKVYADGAISVQERPVAMHKGAVCIPSDFLRTIFNKLFLVPRLKPGTLTSPEKTLLKESVPYHKIKKIVLDAGHGGYDPGAIGRDGIKEKYIVLDITKKIKGLLEEAGVQVLMTRDDDRFIPLWRRVEIANRAKADLFISIHANASRTRRLNGFEVYYLSEDIDDNARAQAAAANAVMDARSPSGPRLRGHDNAAVYRHTDTLDAILWDLELTEDRRDAIELGNHILDNIDVNKRAIKNARFFVIKGVRAPSVLVEVGYISNKGECARLGSREYRAEIAGKITKGILEYKRGLEHTQGFTD